MMATIPMARIAGLLLVLGSPATAMATDDILSGEWLGTYACAQGVTALNLSIERDGAEWSGVFAFGPTKSNKLVPRGAYELRVTDRAGTIEMVPGEWIDQPADYVSVGLSGELSEDLMVLAGTMDYEGCDTFEVRRTTPLPVLSTPKSK